jgi:hypothetical protein
LLSTLTIDTHDQAELKRTIQQTLVIKRYSFPEETFEPLQTPHLIVREMFLREVIFPEWNKVAFGIAGIKTRYFNSLPVL